jgi:hypothetical protein
VRVELLLQACSLIVLNSSNGCDKILDFGGLRSQTLLRIIFKETIRFLKWGGISPSLALWQTERRGWLISSSVSCSETSSSNLDLDIGYSYWRVFVVFLSTPRHMTVCYLKLFQGRFLPIHWSLIVKSYGAIYCNVLSSVATQDLDVSLFPSIAVSPCVLHWTNLRVTVLPSCSAHTETILAI